MQYLTKESPLNQGLKQLHNRPVQQKPMERKPDVEPMNLPELATPKLKEQYRKKTGPTGIAPEKQKFAPAKDTKTGKIYPNGDASIPPKSENRPDKETFKKYKK